ncbi:MAG: prenyltransferase/squalene oxidase repeat-containing protein [Planctomycetota bacterium]
MRAHVFIPVLVCVLLASMGGAFAQEDEEVKKGPVDAPLWKKIDQAIQNGVKWLKDNQKPSGEFGDGSKGPNYGGGNTHGNKAGIAAFSVLALLKSEVPTTDESITKGMQYVYRFIKTYHRNNSAGTSPVVGNYEFAAVLMMIEGFCEAKKRERDSKRKSKTPKKFREPRYSPAGEDKSVAALCVRCLLEDQTEPGGWRYGGGLKIVGSHEDVSATHFILLGLKSAQRLGISVPQTTFKKAMQYILSMQDADGPVVPRPSEQAYRPGDRSTYASMNDRARGWRYITKTSKDGETRGETRVSGGMTCAGIGSLLVVKSGLKNALPKKEQEIVEQAIYDGFAWLYSHWTVAENPDAEYNRRYYYYLWGLERVGVLGMYEKVGIHWWYKEGAEVLVAQQQGDGRWETGKEVVPCDYLDTCYALLFLKRGTVPIGDVMTPRVSGLKK